MEGIEDLSTRLNRIAAEAKQRNPEGFHSHSDTDSNSDDDNRDLGRYVNPTSGQQFCLLATTVNIPLHLKSIE
eukprot:CAMPEP_0204823360 /NCGR_PEP_ID=MMETSP1346-20131115/1392_1 /ASSEMBLY_ACC=CAM_ASM_000771 /TAXON_ID=215587 /ORGANISM="Aplanochytrium stocchinoi, Strain GSBS06" /LENGTH=72 /DNA_ID=CAMNT_0051949949 /DNA_START=273 /DNA_END=494 /DNA_ORIENTATION=-